MNQLPERMTWRRAAALLLIGAALASCSRSSSPDASTKPVASASACAGQETWPSAALNAGDANIVDASQFISQEQLQTWGVELDHLGLRATGSPAHEENIGTLAARLKCAGVQDVHLEDVPLDVAKEQMIAAGRDPEFAEATTHGRRFIAEGEMPG